MKYYQFLELRPPCLSLVSGIVCYIYQFCDFLSNESVSKGQSWKCRITYGARSLDYVKAMGTKWGVFDSVNTAVANLTEDKVSVANAKRDQRQKTLSFAIYGKLKRHCMVFSSNRISRSSTSRRWNRYRRLMMRRFVDS